MKTVAHHARRGERSLQTEKSGDGRQSAVESGVEAGHLWKRWRDTRYLVDGAQLGRQMIGRQWNHVVERSADCCVDAHRLTKLRAAVNETMSDRLNRREQRICLQALEQLRDGRGSSDTSCGVLQCSAELGVVAIGDGKKRVLERRGADVENENGRLL